jgi:hypothetical protein
MTDTTGNLPNFPTIVIEVQGGCVVAVYYFGRESEVIVYDRDVEATCSLDEHYGEEPQDKPTGTLFTLSMDDLPDAIRQAVEADMREE